MGMGKLLQFSLVEHGKYWKRGFFRAAGSHGVDFPKNSRKIHEKTTPGWEGIIKPAPLNHYPLLPLPFASPWDVPNPTPGTRHTEKGPDTAPGPFPGVIPRGWTLTFLHHSDVHAALEPAGLAVPPVVLGDVAVPAEGTGEHGLPLHAPPGKKQEKGKKHLFGLNSHWFG